MGVLSGLTVAVYGTHPHEPHQIKKWVEANGGRWSPSFRIGVTHVITSKAAWKKAADPIQQASDRGVWLVSFDWLEDSLNAKRKLSEKRYTWDHLVKEKQKRREWKKLGAQFDSKKFLDGCEIAKELTGSGTSPALRKPRQSKGFFFGSSTSSSKPALDLENKDADEDTVEDTRVKPQQPSLSSHPQHTKPSKLPKTLKPASTSRNSSASASVSTDTAVGSNAKASHFKDLYHYYIDNDGFEYKIMLVRSDFSSNSFARYHIGLLESHAKPHTYCTVVQFTPPAKKNVGQMAVTGKQEVPESALKSMLQKFLEEAGNNATLTSDKVAGDLSEDERPFKSLICPMNSDFVSSFRAFRYAFRDITLLAWEERFDHDKVIQKARAKEMNIEPYLYSKPAKGMPIGLFPQIAGIMERMQGEHDDFYTRDTFSLPSISHPISKHGAIGAALQREEEELERKEREARLEAEANENVRKKQAMADKKKATAEKRNANYNKPFYNGSNGRSQSVVTYGAPKRRKPFPKDRD
ncbi:hypothetical protein IQ07DRAFT_245979 [Pyrenochaeta sp. DS3sAY3a]|nr:hypothetical protein IQ07DRAFT_245979 [Pyrenochaeta sp. DS3sAY3a]